MRFDNKVAIVTGGASGIGLATAQLLSQEGARVVLMACNKPRGQAAVEQITAACGQAVIVPGDQRCGGAAPGRDSKGAADSQERPN